MLLSPERYAICSPVVYIWDTCAMQGPESADNTTTLSSPAVPVFGVGAGEVGDEDIVEVPVDHVVEDLHGKEVQVFLLHPQEFERRESWRANSTVDG